MNAYRELFTVNVDEWTESHTVYECGECGVTVTDIPVHERFHVKVDAMFNYLSSKQEVKPEVTYGGPSPYPPGIFERLSRMDLSPEAMAWVEQMRKDTRSHD